MADTVRTWPDLQARLADNTTREISPQDLRDALHTFRAHGYMTVDAGTTATTTNASAYTTLDLSDFSNAPNNIGITPDKTNDRLTLGEYGVYMVCAALAVRSSVAATTYTIRAALDGASIPGSFSVDWRAVVATAGMPLVVMTPVTYSSGNGYVTLEAIALSGTPTLTILSGSFGAYRIA